MKLFSWKDNAITEINALRWSKNSGHMVARLQTSVPKLFFFLYLFGLNHSDPVYQHNGQLQHLTAGRPARVVGDIFDHAPENVA
ncbi:MAG: hypothetical protein R3C10_15340 [Pirellulales bacterium]